MNVRSTLRALLAARRLWVLVPTAAVILSCGPSGERAAGARTEAAPAARPPAAVDAARLTAADAEPGEWMSTGRTYGEQRFSPLAEINTGNASELGLAWYGDLHVSRAQESTPLYVDGVLYVTTAWSNVKAYDARSGELRWSFDAKVPRDWGTFACCDVVNRGVAVWSGKVYVGQPVEAMRDPSVRAHSIKIIPLYSGYRDEKTHKVELPTKYRDITSAIQLREKEHEPANPADPLARDLADLRTKDGDSIEIDIQDMGIVILWSEIQSLTMYDDNIYKAFQAMGPPPSKETPIVP